MLWLYISLSFSFLAAFHVVLVELMCKAVKHLWVHVFFAIIMFLNIFNIICAILYEAHHGVTPKDFGVLEALLGFTHGNHVAVLLICFCVGCVYFSVTCILVSLIRTLPQDGWFTLMPFYCYVFIYIPGWVSFMYCHFCTFPWGAILLLLLFLLFLLCSYPIRWQSFF